MLWELCTFGLQDLSIAKFQGVENRGPYSRDRYYVPRPGEAGSRDFQELAAALQQVRAYVCQMTAQSFT